MPITTHKLRNSDWKPVYQYTGGSVSFVTYACDDIPGLTITKDLKGAKVVKTSYTVGGKISDSPTQAVRDWNAHERAKSGGQETAGSVETLAQRRRVEGL